MKLTRRAALAAGLVAGAVVVVLAVAGFLGIVRGTPLTRVRVVGGGGAPRGVADPRFVPAVERYAGVRLTPGHRVEVLLNGDGTYPRLWADLHSARRTITVQLYYAKPSAMADTMAALLAERARAGVRVLVLLDAFGSQDLAKVWRTRLPAAGIRFAVLRPLVWYNLDELDNRSHVRAIVVDGRVGYTGGFGLADYWQGEGHAPGEWRETNVRFEGPAVADLQAAFGIGWAEATGELLAGDPYFPPPDGLAAADAAPVDAGGVRPSGRTRAGLLFTIPTNGSTPAERFMALSITGARRTLYVTNPYFVPDEHFQALLVDAVRRGVDVRVLTPGERSDVKATLYASRARYERLLAGGVRIYEYRPVNVHAKTLVADGRWATVGSMNFDNRSLALNEESNLVVDDVGVGAAMDSLFRHDLAFSQEVVLARFRQRPWTSRVLEWAADLVSPVL